ncbi:MAG TPA: hypothetical protein VGK19_19240 [Capsulimonadaceae bacterium]|jgi:hypothetical protein
MITSAPRNGIFAVLPAIGTALLLATSLITSQTPTHAASQFDTTVAAADLDASVFHGYVDGVESADPASKDGPTAAVWTLSSHSNWSGVAFGDSKTPGRRFLRVGFLKPIAIGSVLVRGGGQLSVLKPTAAYPGNLASDEQWIPAERLDANGVTQAEAAREDYALWVLPPGTTTRALRFSHTALVTDQTFAGWLGGVTVISGRYANVAQQAIARTRSGNERASRINDGTNNGTWGAWDNTSQAPLTEKISAEHPEWVTLTWPTPVKLAGLDFLWTGFSAGDIQTYAGPADKNPNEAGDGDWRTVMPISGLINGYPYQFWPNGVDFATPLTTRAIRVRMMAVSQESHPHLNKRTEDGKRVWLGEIVAVQALGTLPAQTAVITKPTPTVIAHAPIPIRFTLATPGYVTLVIEDASGKRVRNLVSATKFPAGANTVWWDATDDLKRDKDAAAHGLYHIPQSYVAPGAYKVRGLVRPQVDLKYEFAINASGNPPWHTTDGTGGWLTTHTPAQAALFVPAESSPNGKPMVYIGCHIAEGGSGLVWLDLDGKKIGGRTWVGGNWTSAPYMARDAAKGVATDCAYVAAAWKENPKGNSGEIRLTALTAKGDRAIPVLQFAVGAGADTVTGTNLGDVSNYLGGFAVQGGVIVISMTAANALQLVDAATGKPLAKLAVDDPRGAAFDSSGALLLLSGKKLVRFEGDLRAATSLDSAKTLISTGLEDPRGITVDAAGSIYIADWGNSHQVKVFAANGTLQRTIGHAGAPAAGPYDPLHMNHPLGLTVDSSNHLWVAEKDFQPKRVSVWDTDGKVIKTFYGPARYGGGGTLDSRDKTTFYYDGMAFKLDWAAGQSVPSRIIRREDAIEQAVPGDAPELAVYANGKQYYTNSYNSSPTNGAPAITLFRNQNGIAVPCAAMGRANNWSLLKTAAFRPSWPATLNPDGDYWKNQALFAWSDLNGDGIAQPAEVTIKAGDVGGVTLMPDLTMVESRVDGKATAFAPTRFTANGTPVYSLDTSKVLVEGSQKPTSSGGDQAMLSPGGWTILTIAPQPFAPEGIGGVKNGVPLWSYPSVWPGLHASHSAATPTFPGELIGTTRLLGGFVTPKTGEAGPLWSLNANMGNMYVFTEDGLFVAQLFQDGRQGKPWSMPIAQRGMLLNEVSLHDENFFPTINQTEDGAIYLIDGARNAIVSVSGLEQIKRISAQPLTVTAKDIADSQAFFVQQEAERQSQLGSGNLNVPITDAPPVLDGHFEQWPVRDWAIIDRRGTAANFNSDSKPYDISAAVVVSGDNLYAAWRTGDNNLLANSGNELNAPFKTGGALDLQVETSPGGLRLLVTKKQGKTWAVLYRAKVAGTKTPVSFSSPWRTITIDAVEDVSTQVQLTPAGKGNYIVTVPLALLGLKPVAGGTIRADLGILRGDGAQTLQRVYWNNKATGITADVPSEAELTPKLWGKWTFTK